MRGVTRIATTIHQTVLLICANAPVQDGSFSSYKSKRFTRKNK